jgi:oxygen-independent coproporphyrinogen-3 oxidase
MHRTHDAPAVRRAVEYLREAGIESLSLDLIFGLPAGVGAAFARDLDSALALSPGHLSVYGLSIEPRTPLARWISRGATPSPSDDRYAAEFLEAHERLTAAGYGHYEVSNYARPGYRSLHNSVYWQGRAYAGLGPSAHSFSGSERRWNIRDWAAWERAVRSGRNPVDQRESLTPAQRQLERLYLGLRTDAGVPREDWWAIPPALERDWRDRGWLEASAEAFRLTAGGWLYLDLIVSSLTTSADGG